MARPDGSKPARKTRRRRKAGAADGWIAPTPASVHPILPWQGRWLAEGQTEGCPAIVRGTPLRPALRARHLPFQERMAENHHSRHSREGGNPTLHLVRAEFLKCSGVDHFLPSDMRHLPPNCRSWRAVLVLRNQRYGKNDCGEYHRKMMPRMSCWRTAR